MVILKQGAKKMKQKKNTEQFENRDEEQQDIENMETAETVKDSLKLVKSSVSGDIKTGIRAGDYY